MEWKHLKGVLDRYGEFLKERMKQNLLQDGANATGNLTDSINYIVNSNGSTLEVSISLLEYWKYVNYDTKPHFPPVDAIKDWIVAKRIVPQVQSLPNGKTYLPTVPQLAFLIARSISENGTEGNEFFDMAAEEAEQRFMLEVELAIQEDLDEEIDILLIELNK